MGPLLYPVLGPSTTIPTLGAPQAAGEGVVRPSLPAPLGPFCLSTLRAEGRGAVGPVEGPGWERGCESHKHPRFSDLDGGAVRHQPDPSSLSVPRAPSMHERQACVHTRVYAHTCICTLTGVRRPMSQLSEEACNYQIMTL